MSPCNELSPSQRACLSSVKASCPWADPSEGLICLPAALLMPDPVQALFDLSLALLRLHLEFFLLSGWVPAHSRNSPDSRRLFLGVRPLCPSKRTGRQEVEVTTYVVRGLGLEHTECLLYFQSKETGS